jgi:hypothetical protein
MSIDLQQVQSASFIQGLKDYDKPVQVAGTIPTTTLGANTVGGPRTSIDIPFPNVAALALTRIHIDGLSAANSNYWFPLGPGLTVVEGTWQINFISKGISTGRRITVSLNNFSGASQTFGAVNFQAYTHFYKFPWTP